MQMCDGNMHTYTSNSRNSTLYVFAQMILLHFSFPDPVFNVML